ncbi:MAG TPA: branched-chain amino acid ABC transporter permease [Stellaceae bacterium]|nr:branched-chain amino acid ABC transporter permease [Stellaceae bacterium]
MMRRPYHIAVAVAFLVLAGVPAVAALEDQPFYLDLFTRVMVFGIAAMSLDLILGYGGLVSFGHAAYLGLGSYAVGILGYFGVTDGFVQFGTAIAVSSLAALFIGAVSLRTSGVSFVMITLAFAQMLYFLFISLNMFGGDDGMSITQHSGFGPIDLGNPTIFYYLVFAVLALFFWGASRLVDSRFGMVLRGAKSNARRMTALGFPVFRYRLTAFVISAAMCGVAGALLANQLLFVSPAIMQWNRSGEIIIMVILGGIGSLFGSLLGAFVYVMLEHELSALTEHWLVILGPLLILVVLFAKGGLMGLLPRGARG